MPKNPWVKIALAFLAAILVGALLLAYSQKAHAAQAFDPNAPCVYVDNVEWKRWGGAPYGPTAAEALTDPKLDWYLKCSTAIPQHLKAKVKAAIRANPKGEQTAYLTPDMTLPEMASGPDRSHRTQHIMRNAKVARIVQALGIVLAAETPIWSVKDADGSTLVVGDPFRCGNLSVIRIIPAPPAVVVVECAKVHITVPSGTVRSVRFTLDRRAPIQDFNCWGVIEREWRTGAPRNCDWCEWTRDGLAVMQQKYSGVFDFFHTSIYQLHSDASASGNLQSTQVTLVFPLAARDEGVSICVEVDGKIYEAALILPSTWKGGSSVTIPADYWMNPRIINP